uniref:Uncharacterized protein n=1 Tax=Romanomermis culicivorax TaxID=13658 RepID=A0A915JHP1_ROMCU
MDDLNAQLVPTFQCIVEQISENADDNALMGFSFDHPDLTKGRVLIPFRAKHALTGDLIVNTFNAVLQSNQQIQIDSREATIHTILVTPPTGHDKVFTMLINT